MTGDPMAQHAAANPDDAMSVAARAAFVLAPLGLFVLVAWVLATKTLPFDLAWPWIPSLGIEFRFRIDGLAALMLLMITGIGTAVFVYAGGYLAGDPNQRRLFWMLVLFMVAMVGCVTADDLFVLFLFWEATSLTSFMLVGYSHARAESRKAAQQALLVTGTGGLALLAGFIVLAQATGTTRISDIVEIVPTLGETPALATALGLILVGAFTKSAQFPFHFWLPNAMAAPTPVSAYLHSATMVKLGVFLLARLDPAFGEWPLWEWTLKIVGSVTAAWGMVLALRERDLKRILAWSTVATLGTLVMLVGLRGEGAAIAVGALLLAHGLYKAPLFFVAGNIDHGTGTRVIDRLGGLRRQMPWTAAAALLAGASMAGMPLSFGYIVKDVILEAKTAVDVFTFAKAANTVFGSIAVAVAGVAAIRVFWLHPGVNEACDAHECGPSLIGPPLILALLGITLGLFPFYVEDLIAMAGVAMIPGTEVPVIGLSLAAGPVLGSLAVTLAVGVGIYLLWDPLHQRFERIAARTGRIGMASQYERSLTGIPAFAAAVTRRVQDGRLPSYVGLVAASAAVAIVVAIGQLVASGAAAWAAIAWPGLGFAGAAALVIAGALVAPFVRDRVVLLLAVGLVGFGSALLFVFAGAPDVAWTQFTVETVFVIVVAAVLLGLKRLGRGASVAEPRFRPLALGVSVVLGAAVAALLMLATAGPFDATLPEWFGRTSVPEAYGRNVVNVILVDFRALDTLGEIAVVLLSLLAALPLVGALRRRRASAGDVR
jgi:multicomponent Na+:H+ antiporter subunit A